MKTTKEDILMKSLELFAERGYEAVSTAMIASELGITKGALYRHFENKQAIFDAILAKMFELDAKQAEDNRVPQQAYEESAEPYENTALTDLCGFVNEQFLFWTENGFAKLFRRMITVEQFKTPEKNRLCQDVLAMGPVRYTEDIFREMMKNGKLNEEAKRLGARDLATELFAPLYLSIRLYDGGADGEELKKTLRTLTKNFETRYIEGREIQ